jgi:hypothetical protein
MRDNFDFPQAYMELHYKAVKFFAGRQLLNIGNERVIGISDWRPDESKLRWVQRASWGQNRVDLFSASVVNIYPTSLDMHSGGLNYHIVESLSIGTLGLLDVLIERIFLS